MMLNKHLTLRYCLIIPKIDQIANRLNSHWEEGGTCVGNESKCDRHVLRVAAVLHVFMSVMAMKLNRREPLAPPSENIAYSTFKAAIKLVGYFKDQMKILEQVRVSFRRLMLPTTEWPCLGHNIIPVLHSPFSQLPCHICITIQLNVEAR